MADTAIALYTTSRYFRILKTERIPCTIFLMNGFQMHNVILIDNDSHSILMEVNGKQQVVFRQAISTIAPSRPVNMSSPTMSEGSSE
ncbi:MAG: RNA chaperone Hfq [Oscillibacter sp.]|nr:RNA chaperone Hfq [Oscillibacter sp.]